MTGLAIMGGKPVRDELLPYSRQNINDRDIEAVVKALRSDYLTTGPIVKEFETEFAKYVGTKYAVAVCNGTAALHAACFAAGIKEGDEVITTSMTFAASANAVLYCGGKVIFADIDLETRNISVESIKRLITKNTKAIIPVDYTGMPCDMDSIMAIAKEHNLLVIEDAAHSLGANYKGAQIGSIADMTTFSFHPVKHITTGEGGMIVTDSDALYNRLLTFRTHGITRDVNLLKENHGPWYYEQQDLGYNYRITDFQCALGLSQLSKNDVLVKRRCEIAERYNREFEKLKGISTPRFNDEYQSSWHLYVIELSDSKLNRREVYEAFIAENIGVNVHYIPVYYHPYYNSLGYAKGLCPNSEELYRKIISLPIFPTMTEKDILDVIAATKKVINYFMEK